VLIEAGGARLGEILGLNVPAERSAKTSARVEETAGAR
jgi:hypothetical protein